MFIYCIIFCTFIISISQASYQLNEEMNVACKTGNITEIKRLMQSGVSVHAPFSLPLRLAAENRHAQVVEYIISTAEFNPRGHLTIEALFAAIENKDEVIAHMLLQSGIDVTERDNLAIRIAARKGNLVLFNLLVSYGADPLGHNNITLQIALREGNRNIAERIKELESERTKTSEGITPHSL